eukprot:93200-Pleurochrysis_carterae.AAC.1
MEFCFHVVRALTLSVTVPNTSIGSTTGPLTGRIAQPSLLLAISCSPTIKGTAYSLGSIPLASRCRTDMDNDQGT